MNYDKYRKCYIPVQRTPAGFSEEIAWDEFETLETIGDPVGYYDLTRESSHLTTHLFDDKIEPY